MLATMTFSAEFLLMTVFGLATGYTLFFNTKGDSSELSADALGTHVNVNPCCNFMEDEAKEHPTQIVPTSDGLGQRTQAAERSTVDSIESNTSL